MRAGDTVWAIVTWRDSMGREVPERGLVVRSAHVDNRGRPWLPQPYTGAQPLNGRWYKTERGAYTGLSRATGEVDG